MIIKNYLLLQMANFLIQDKKIVKYIKVNVKDTPFAGTPQEYKVLRKTYDKYEF